MNTSYHFGNEDGQTQKKICKTCGKEKPLSEFHRQDTCKGGYRPVCKQCKKERDAQPKIPVQRTLPLFILSKKCTKCGEEKKVKEFNYMKSSIDGYHWFCRACQSEYNKQHRKENFEHYQIYDKQRSVDPHRKEVSDNWHRTQQVTNLEYIQHKREIRHQHYLRYPEKARQQMWKRIARKRRVTFEEIDYNRILERDGPWCYICEQDILPHQKLEFDHVVPLQPRPGELQGEHTEQNLRPAHSLCNRRKLNKQVYDLTSHDRSGPPDWYYPKIA